MSASAAGLFRATGKKAKPKTIRLLNGTYAKVDSVERREDDFYPTPPEPTQAFILYEHARLIDFDSVWEPACGDGAMVREMQRAGFEVIASDVVDRGCGAVIGDFFAFSEPLGKAIVTNPPYNAVNGRDSKGRWIRHAMEELQVDYMALLLNWAWPGSAALAGVWHDWPPARVYLMRWKIDFTGEGAPPNLNGWFVWDRRHKGETILRMMDRVNCHQGVML